MVLPIALTPSGLGNVAANNMDKYLSRMGRVRTSLTEEELCTPAFWRGWAEWLVGGYKKVGGGGAGGAGQIGGTLKLATIQEYLEKELNKAETQYNVNKKHDLFFKEGRENPKEWWKCVTHLPSVRACRVREFFFFTPARTPSIPIQGKSTLTGS